MIKAQSKFAIEALKCVEELQEYFVTKLNELSCKFGENLAFEQVSWLRDNGTHGGGSRYESRDESIFNRASVNVSQVHYDDMPEKKLSSATAISTIIHPDNPRASSMHMHISLTEMRDGTIYWRIMADLNPSIKNELDKKIFDTMLHDVSVEYYEEGTTQGNRYFTIPVLNRTRGVSHFYLENFTSNDFNSDLEFARKFGKNVIDTYIKIIANAMTLYTSIRDIDKAEQLEYHTTYLFQVLTLDRGTTSGLIIHDQNDIGIMGSIPAYIDVKLLKSWLCLMPEPQDKLLESIIEVLGGEGVVYVDETIKKQLANTVRDHYKNYPEALSMQASGNIVPPTVNNHS
jgi:coproporphyrinogen III oxidase